MAVSYFCFITLLPWFLGIYRMKRINFLPVIEKNVILLLNLIKLGKRRNKTCYIFIGILLLLAMPAFAQNQATDPTGEQKTKDISPEHQQPDNGTPSQAVIEPSPKSLPQPKEAVLNSDASDISDQATVDVMQLKDMNIKDVLNLLSEKTGLNIIAGQGISGQVTIFLKNIKLKDVLRIILDSNNLAYAVEDGVVYVMPAQEFERRYGHAFGGDIRTKIIRLVYADVTEMAGFLNQVKSSAGKIIAELRSNTIVLMDSPSQLQLMEKLVQEVDVPVTTRVFELSYIKVKELAEKISGTLSSKSGSVRYDEPSNKVIVTDTEQTIEQIAKVIEAFDIKREQVLIEAKIIQVVLSDQNKLGVDWEAVVEKFHNLDMKSHFDLLDSADKSGTISIGTLSGDNYTALLQALNSAGSTNILSSPRIMAVNGQEAKILVGSTEPYVTSTTTTPSSGPTTTAESVNFIEVGVKLYVTPQIHKDRFITMKLKPEVSSVTRTLKTSNNNSIPVVDTSESETTVTIKDGVTIVIGGLIKEEKILTKNKIPVLGDIPFLGHAFRNSDDLKRKTEIVVFITPHIITGDVPAGQK